MYWTAYQAGYDFSGKFQSVEKGQVTGADVTGNDILNSYNYGHCDPDGADPCEGSRQYCLCQR